MCDHCSCRTFPPIAELTAEHEDILALAWELAEADRTGTPPDPATRRRLVDLLTVHVEKEETGLYPLLEEIGSLAADRTAALEAEHVEVHAVLDGGTFDRRHYYALATHIEEEEMELFPLAMLGFDPDTWDDMAAAHEHAHTSTAAAT